MVRPIHKDFGLVGKKLGHSLSPELFRTIFNEYGVDASYHLFEIQSIDEIGSLPVRYPYLQGFNVTVPYKEAILPFLDELTSVAREIAAVNTVYIDRYRCGKNGKFRLIGHNTDCSGFRKSLEQINIKDGKALVLGSGGASRAVSRALYHMASEVIIVSRNPHPYPISYGKESSLHIISYDDIDQRMLREANLIVNATPVGMGADLNSAPPLPYHLIDRSLICYDLVYNPSVTLFLKRCLERGATVMNGFSMLKYQAYDAWHFWLRNMSER